MTTAALADKQCTIDIHDGDIDIETYERMAGSPLLAWDIETTGLDWREDRVCTVQLADRGAIVIVQHLDSHPLRLKRLLEASCVAKVFHHAMFDLRFMASAWGAAPSNVSCTKIASKLLRIPKAEQSLAPLARRYLGVTLSKDQQVSDWTTESLNAAQLNYAAGDVRYLVDLMSLLRRDLEAAGRWDMAEACFAHLPTRVALELEGFEDVFVY